MSPEVSADPDIPQTHVVLSSLPLVVETLPLEMYDFN